MNNNSVTQSWDLTGQDNNRITFRKVYFVDTENVRSSWITLLPTFDERDIVRVFYTVNTNALTYDDLEAIMTFKGLISFHPCEKGKNALDFQLSVELGRNLSPTFEEYIIVSNDTGFDAVVNYASNKGYKVSRIATPQIGLSKRDAFLSLGCKLSIKQTQLTDLLQIIDDTSSSKKTKRLSKIYTSIIQKYGQKAGCELYQKLKPHITAYIA